MKIASWNCYGVIGKRNGKDVRERFDGIIDVLKSKKFDIICLQEDFFYTKNHLPNYTIIHPKKEYRLKLSSGLTTMIKKSIQIIHTVFIKFNSCTGILNDQYDCWAEKGFLISDIIWKKKNLRIINTHLNAGKSKKDIEVRKKQLGQIAEKLTNCCILIGDLNMKATALSSFSKKHNLSIANHYCDCNGNECKSFKSFDHVLTKNVVVKIPRHQKKGIKVINFPDLSDHQLITGIF